MTAKEKIINMWTMARPHALRALYCAFIFSFLLPYVDVMGCTTKKMSSYHGYQLIRGESAVLYVLTILIFAAFLILSFYRKETGRALKAFAACWRAMSAALCGLIIWLIPGLQFLFDGVFMRAGQLLGIVCCAVVFTDGMAISIRDYIGLRRRPGAAEGGAPYSKALLKFHAAVIFISLALVPVYSVGLHDELGLAALYFLLLSLPFALSQCIVMEGVRRGERWTRRWAAGVSVLLTGAVALSVLGLM